MRAVLIRVAWWAGAPIRAALIGLIRLYRVTVGQVLLGGQCRFYPSCSSYAEAAIRELGWIRGLGLAIWRIARCNPFNAGGVDHPPERRGRPSPLYDDVNHMEYDSVIRPGVSAQVGMARPEVETFGHEAVQGSGGSS